MRASVVLHVESATLKKLLAGVAELEAALPYEGDGFRCDVESIDVKISPGTYDLECTRVDENRKIQSIKCVREFANGFGLKEAKEAVENLISYGTPIKLGTYTSKVEALKAQQEASNYGSLYATHVTDGKHR